MKGSHEEKRSRKKRKLTRAVLPIAVIAMLLLGGIIGLAVMIMKDDEEKPTGSGGAMPATGDSSMDPMTRDQWEEYLESAPGIEPLVMDPETRERELDLELVDSLPDSDVEPPENMPNGSQANMGDDDEYGDVSSAGEREEDADGVKDGGGDREVEESDIVKAVGDRLFLLNSYIGLIIVDLADPDDPSIEGRAQIPGTPVSMYIVDFLAFVLVSNAPPIEEGEEESSPGRMYIIDITDTSNPRIVHYENLKGYPVDSRRVGEVIYVVSNIYPYYYGGYIEEGGIGIDTVTAEKTFSSDDEDDCTQKIEIMSIGFFDPEDIGTIDSEYFSGSANNIYASQWAIFVSQPQYERVGPMTEITYVDISDPKGDIKVRGSIMLDGFLNDRYQLDYYDGMFRAVTQQWGEDLAESTLYVIDCGDPDDLDVIGSLLIDDAGDLMATRFAGERGYTIHLPRSVDPLDVLDLSDPGNPRLCDVLEMPGWVEHMEVRGYHIIALGVDDSGGEWKVALTLFNVSDPYNAVMKERVLIGEGYTYSEANWDPKALTILDDKGLVLIPYSSYGRGMGGSGIRLVSFDLEEETLELRGDIEGRAPVTRTREVNGNVIATSDRYLQSIDASDPDSPVVEATLELAANVVDAFRSEGMAVQLIEPTWGTSGARIKVTPWNDLMGTSAEFGPEGLYLEQIRRSGDIVFLKGIRQPDEMTRPVWELWMYDMSTPLEPGISGPAVIPLEASGEPIYRDFEEEAPGAVQAEYQFLYWDPYTWEIVGPDTVLIRTGMEHCECYDYGRGEEPYSGPGFLLVRFQEDGGFSIDNLSIPNGYYFQNSFPGEGGFVLSSWSWWGDYSSVLPVRYSDEGIEIGRAYNVRGDVVGISSNLSLVYTQLSYYTGDEYGVTLNVYDIRGSNATFLAGARMDTWTYGITVRDGSIVAVSSQYLPYIRGEPVDPMDITDPDEDEYDERYEDDIREIVVVEEDLKDSSEPSEPGSDGEAGGEDSWDEIVWKETTNIIIMELENGIPTDIRSIELDGSYYPGNTAGDSLFLQGNRDILGVSLHGGEFNIVGQWTVNGYVQGGELYPEGDSIAALGLWGAVTLPYSSR